MNNLNIGKLIESEQERDAIHVAVVPVVALGHLLPASRIGFVEGSTEVVANPNEAGIGIKAIGIVDPFLDDWVKPGERFWMFLFPGTITSLRHDWTHPAFAKQMPGKLESDAAANAVEWIGKFATEISQTYESLMDAANKWTEFGDSTYDNSDSYKNVDYDNWKVFWEHYRTVTGRKIGECSDVPFTCSC